MTWQTVYSDGLEAPFFDQDGISELTIPAGHQVRWDQTMDRPEMDVKRLPQREVSPDGGQQSAVGFLPYKKFRWWCYTEVPISIAAGRRTMASAAVMIVSHGIGGNSNRAGACGMRVGLSPADELDPRGSGIVWSDWWVVRDNLDNERIWHTLKTPELVPAIGEVRLWIQCNADVAASISAGHWDAECIEQWIEDSGGGGGVTEERVRELIEEFHGW